MAFFYFDESIHGRGGFISGAFVAFPEDPSQAIAAALNDAGLRPGVDEFKSGTRMDRNPTQAKARDLIHQIVQERSRIGVVVAPDVSRSTFGLEALRGLEKFVVANNFGAEGHQVFFDMGLVSSQQRFQHLAASLQLSSCRLHIEQDSKRVLGLQAADLVAHTCAVMLLAQLGLIDKIVKAGENSGYDPDDDMELEFMLWAGLRWNFLAAPGAPPDQWESQLDWQVDVSSRGLYIAATCDEVLRQAAESRFGKMYLGCIH